MSGVAFSPDGKLLASADSDGTVRLWNPATSQPAGAPIDADRGSTKDVYGVAFSPDGKLLASADYDGTVRLWNSATHQPLGSPLRAGIGTHGYMNGVAFSPDGQLLAGANGDGTVDVWVVSLIAHPYAALCGEVGPPTQKDWRVYAPGERWPGRFCH